MFERCAADLGLECNIYFNDIIDKFASRRLPATQSLSFAKVGSALDFGFIFINSDIVQKVSGGVF